MLTSFNGINIMFYAIKRKMCKYFSLTLFICVIIPLCAIVKLFQITHTVTSHTTLDEVQKVHSCEYEYNECFVWLCLRIQLLLLFFSHSEVVWTSTMNFSQQNTIIHWACLNACKFKILFECFNEYRFQTSFNYALNINMDENTNYYFRYLPWNNSSGLYVSVIFVVIVCPLRRFLLLFTCLWLIRLRWNCFGLSTTLNTRWWINNRNHHVWQNTTKTTQRPSEISSINFIASTNDLNLLVQGLRRYKWIHIKISWKRIHVRI